MLHGKRYSLTQLGFGLNIAPMIMWSIMTSVMSQDRTIQWVTLSYINNVLVNERLTFTNQVKEHLAKFEIAGKTPKWLQDRAQVLRLHIQNDGSRLKLAQGCDIPEFTPVMTWQTIFLVCGNLVGDFPRLQLALHGDSIHETSCQQSYNCLGWLNKQHTHQEHARRYAG